MKTALAAALIVGLGALPIVALPHDGAVARGAQRIEALNNARNRPDDLAFAGQMRAEYASTFASLDSLDHLHHESDDELKLHWEAVSTAAFYSDNRDLARAALRVYSVLHQRGLADARVTRSMFNSLVKARLFAEAREFVSASPDASLPSLPDFIVEEDVRRPSVWAISPDGRVAKRSEIDLQPLQIIVAVGCHFSADAAKDIVNDPILGPVFARHARWLSLPLGGEQVDDLVAWNAAHPQARMLPIYDRSEWAMIPRWRMPTFAIIQNGKLIDSTAGWSSGDATFRDNLIALLRRTGLIEIDASAD